MSTDIRDDTVSPQPDIARLPAKQQPDWYSRDRLADASAEIWTSPGIVDPAHVRELRDLLAEAAAGEMVVLQAGDCAEDPRECDPSSVADKVAMLDAAADVLRSGTGLPVLRVGRMAGQFAKPRSEPVEVVDGTELPVYRGPAVNSPEPTEEDRRPDPMRLLWALNASRRGAQSLDRLGHGRGRTGIERIWLSHEALLLDYELPLVRPMPSPGGDYLTSTHWPWVGERTRQLDGAHVRLLAGVQNPVSCKIGPSASADDVRELCAVLDPYRDPGRLTLIARFGADRVDALGELVRAVADAGHPVCWLCDPMHGNTSTRPDGLKTRALADVLTEIRGFRAAVEAGGGVPAGLHLEATPNEIGEVDGAGVSPEPGCYESLCDPRLNTTQLIAAAAAWGSR